MLLVLALQPELAQQLQGSVDDVRVMNRFVEEVLRLEPPSHGLFRTTMREVQLGGKTLPAHAQICVLFASANRSEEHTSELQSLMRTPFAVFCLKTNNICAS